MNTFATSKKEIITQDAARSVFGLVASELGQIEMEFERQVQSNIEVIRYLGDYLRSSGGKRVRPALVVLTSYAVGGQGDTENVVRMATVMEMLHTATLVHDDIIDNADTRRNRPSVNAKFGNQAAVLMGDWLYMSAFETSLRERSLDILEILTRLTRKMTEGELIQMTMIGRLDITITDYFDILRRKTAYLFSSCCEIGAILGGGRAEMQAAMREYGLNLGVAFQLADDLLDLTSDSESLGKSAGADLLEGKLTLPLIKLVSRDTSMRAVFEQIIADGDYSSYPRARIIERLNNDGIIESITREAVGYATRAKKSLEVLPETAYRSALEEISNFVIQRNA
jgi:octaprenyl-diphosphate synthase